jgi:hypothetical protein
MILFENLRQDEGNGENIPYMHAGVGPIVLTGEISNTNPSDGREYLGHERFMLVQIIVW